jgi:hypothetical protein
MSWLNYEKRLNPKGGVPAAIAFFILVFCLPWPDTPVGPVLGHFDTGFNSGSLVRICWLYPSGLPFLLFDRSISLPY